MTAAAQRTLFRALHLVLSIPIIGYIYGPVADIPQAAFAVRFLFVPAVVLSGLWMWKGHLVRRLLPKRSYTMLACLLALLDVSVAEAGDADAARIRQRLEATPKSERVTLTDAEWRKVLTPAQFLVLRQGATEPAHRNEYANTHTKGVYLCGACGNELFDSSTKFESGTGWPSFYLPLAESKVTVATDNSAGLKRREVRCARCGSHLGHLFNDGPAPTHLRYCLNSAALQLKTNNK